MGRGREADSLLSPHTGLDSSSPRLQTRATQSRGLTDCATQVFLECSFFEK